MASSSTHPRLGGLTILPRLLCGLTLGPMGELLLRLLDLLSSVARLPDPRSAKALVAEILAIEQRLLLLARSPRGAPDVALRDRVLLGLRSVFLRRTQIEKVAVAPRARDTACVPPGLGQAQPSAVIFQETRQARSRETGG